MTEHPRSISIVNTSHLQTFLWSSRQITRISIIFIRSFSFEIIIWRCNLCPTTKIRTWIVFETFNKFICFINYKRKTCCTELHRSFTPRRNFLTIATTEINFVFSIISKTCNNYSTTRNISKNIFSCLIWIETRSTINYIKCRNSFFNRERNSRWISSDRIYRESSNSINFRFWANPNSINCKACIIARNTFENNMFTCNFACIKVKTNTIHTTCLCFNSRLIKPCTIFFCIEWMSSAIWYLSQPFAIYIIIRIT